MTLYRSNSHGFSLVEVLIAATITSIIGLVVASMITNMQLGVSSAEFRLSSQAFKSSATSLLADEKACSNSFNGIVADSSTNQTITVLRDGALPTGNVAYQTGQYYDNRIMKISSMTLSGYRAGASATEGWLALTINLEAGKTVSGPANVSRMLEISVRTDASKKIISCIATGAAGSGGYWIATPSFNGIYFSGGKVGVGTSSPAADLHVVGNIAAGNYLGGVGNTNSALGLYSDDSLQNGYQAWGAGTTNPNSLALVTNGSSRIQIDSQGRVGIGKAPEVALDVSGGIRPGSSGVTIGASCAPALEGTLAYDQVAGEPVFCGRTGLWTPSSGQVTFTYPKRMISQGGLSGTWTVTTTSPSSLGVPAFARELLILTRCNQAADVGVSGLTGGVIILCNSVNNDTNSGTLWIKRNIEGRDLANSFVISGTGNGGASFVEMYVIGYR